MLLSELIVEKDYIQESINRLHDYIRSLLITYDKIDAKHNKEIISQKFEELDKLYGKYQQYTVAINRSEFQTTIKVKETELGLKDAIIVKDSMIDKLKKFEVLLERLLKFDRSLECIVCIEIDDLIDVIDNIRSDIQALDIKIQQALWNTEVL